MSEYKISELTAHPTGLLGDDDLIEVSYYAGGIYYSRKLTGAELKESSNVGLIYKANLTQTSTNAPTADVFQNTLGGTPSFARTSQGVYTMTLTGAFSLDETHITVNNWTKNGLTSCYRVSNNVIQILTFDTALTAQDDILEDTSITIQVFPNYIS